MKRPDKNELVPKNNWQGLRKRHNKDSYLKAMEDYATWLESQLKILNIPVVVGRSGQFSFADMRDAFDAGDKFRLYLDKNAVGLGYPHDKDIPTSDKVMETMCFDKWIESKR